MVGWIIICIIFGVDYVAYFFMRKVDPKYKTVYMFYLGYNIYRAIIYNKKLKENERKQR